MTLYRYYLPTCLVLLLLIMGCSGKSTIPTSPASSDDLPFIAAMDINDAPGHCLAGYWGINIDTEMLKATIELQRHPEMHINVTTMLPPPGIHVNSYDPITSIVDVDVTINNPYLINGYDVRLIIYTDNIGHKLVNADDWTSLYDIPGGSPYNINPFKAYAKDTPNRRFPGQSQFTENLLVYLPGGNPNVMFAVDASYPGNCEEPFEISGFTQGILEDLIGSTTDVEVTVRDWHNDVNAVYLFCPEITGQPLKSFTQLTTEVWQMDLSNNTGASSGIYDGWLIASSINSGSLLLYDQVEITVTLTGIPTSPVQIASVNIGGETYSVAIQDDYAYVAAGQAGMKVVDIYPPESASVISSLEIDGSESTHGIVLEGFHAYVSTTRFEGTISPHCLKGALAVIDVSDPNNPLIDDPANDIVNLPYPGRHLAFEGLTAYVATGRFVGTHRRGSLNCVGVNDINDPEPTVIASVETYCSHDIAISHHYAFLADGEPGLKVYDVSDPRSPGLQESFNTYNAYGIDIDGAYAYIADSWHGLKIIDVSIPTNVYLIGEIATNDWAYNVTVVENFAYIADGEAGLTVVDVSDPTNPLEYGDGLDTDGNAMDIVVVLNYAYLADGWGGLKIIQLWD